MKRFAKAVLIVAAVVVVGFFALIMGVRYLFLGQFTAPTSADFVKIAKKSVIQKGNTGSLWTHNLDQLHHAIIAKDKSFTYDAGSLPGGWTLLPPLD